jgi:hypothetical protein
MFNITKFIRELKKGFKYSDDYLQILSLEEFTDKYRMVHLTKLSLEERKENYRKLTPLIVKLRPIFKKRVVEFNKFARKVGYANQLDHYSAINSIPRHEFEDFLKSIDRFVSLVHSGFPATELAKKTKDWSMFSIPAPQGRLNLRNKFGVPDEIIKLVSKYDPRVKKYKDRIQIDYEKEPKDGLSRSSAQYDAEKDIAIINLLQRGWDELEESLTFVHELGHSLDYLECIENKIIPFNLPKYIEEYSAIEFTHKFINKEISKKEQKLIRYNQLYSLSSTLFEIDILTNDKQDFDKAYARAINRCYPKAKQTSNPLYLFENNFITRPLMGLIYNIIKVELYLKEAERANRN